ncbi:MAG: sigma-70 family RNA polymerase sigma factor [bacterium]|nr:sigma-70 family RNA polymerase sigma factor [bacterium]
MAGDVIKENAWIQSAQAGDIEAFNSLILQYQDMAFTIAYRMMGDAQRAADATQDAFLTAFRRLETYLGGNFKAWLMKIVTNTCYDALRYEKRRPATAFDDLTPDGMDDEVPIPDTLPTPEQHLQSAELSQAIQQCIDALGEDQRIVLVMSDIEEYGYQEIADHIGAQLGTVKSRLSRARASIRQCLQAVRELLPDVYRL